MMDINVAHNNVQDEILINRAASHKYMYSMFIDANSMHTMH